MAATGAPPSTKRTNTIYITGGPTKLIQTDYKVGKQLGRPGNFGVAKECRRKSDGVKFAVKIIEKAKFHHSGEVSHVWQDMKNEINIMRSLEHDNVVKFVEVYEDKAKVYIVQELCAGGELFDYIQNKQKLQEGEAAGFMAQIFEGLKFLHSESIVHCDLKPDNFLFTEAGGTIKIIDFGMSKRLPRLQKLNMLCGTPYYTAPECIDKNYSHAADMWSVGVVLFVMLFGFPPFYVDPSMYGRREHEFIYKKIKKGFKPITRKGYGNFFPKAIPVSDEAKDLITLLLKPDPKDRPTAAEALQHPWIRERSSNTHEIPINVIEGIKKFNQESGFKTLVCSIFRSKLRHDELKAVQDAFSALDKNGDGMISREEFVNKMREMSAEFEESNLGKMFDQVDMDGDGNICYHELMVSASHEHLRAEDERLYEAFCEMDSDGDGFITVEELQMALASADDVPEEKIAEFAQKATDFIKSADTNNDGKIDYQEFLQAMHPTVNSNETIPAIYSGEVISDGTN